METTKLPHLAIWSAMMAEEILSISEPPYSAGTSTLVRPISAAFLSRSRRDLPVLVLDLFDGREEFVDRKLVGELGDHLLVFVEVFRSEDVLQVVVFEQKASAREFRLGSYRCCGHAYLA